ncbi:MAG TPA: hypothetical protein VLD84_02805 [Nitrososphaeraceae archaeon]|nr:hypothetical protein [Nitrososphaeraceae archaeon]
MKLDEMTRNIPEKPIKMAIVLTETSNRILDSNSQAEIKEFRSCFPLHKDSH